MAQRILLIEDNPMDALAVEDALTLGPGAFEIERAAALAPGIRKAQERGYHLALLDLGLPDSAGLSTLTSFRSEASSLPVVVLTGAADERLGLEAVQLGAQDYLVKARDLEILPRSVRYAIERSRAQDSLDQARRAAERQERIAALGTLVAGVAHEINNPLTYIRGNVELSTLSLEDMRPGLADEGLRAALDESIRLQRSALEGIDRVAKLTQSLRRFSRGPGAPRQPVDVNRILEMVRDLFSSQPHEALELRVEAADVPRILADESEVVQVVLNLVLNGAQAMEWRGRLVLRTESSGSTVSILVRDSGPGVPPEVEARLFTPFFTTKPDGTGLGLSVSRRIVTDHGGALTFRNLPQGGAEFRVDLPALT